MKILKAGKSVVYKGTCNVCECEFECGYFELFPLVALAGVLRDSAHCPSCGVLTKMKAVNELDK